MCNIVTIVRHVRTPHYTIASAFRQLSERIKMRECPSDVLLTDKKNYIKSNLFEKREFKKNANLNLYLFLLRVIGTYEPTIFEV